MHDNRAHPLLAQVPLTVSPFISLPTSTTLPYTYRPMPSTIPPSATGITSTSSASASGPDGTGITTEGGGSGRPRYVVSQSGHAAHPDDIIASCRALQAHVSKLQADAEQELRDLDERIRSRELAEKRRVAPGWLDSDARLLEPERAGGDGNGAGMDLMTGDGDMAAHEDEGAQLDRAFGDLALRPK
ncbi:hypothetical protein M406DRAFT_297070 [Cryphonectria parasitica EP155]|uniref:Uncharacterized protein n=1 Tax=Cryphonectria parasitica (strain ATCC 38755 / EP155) TaxID=660469 RepID=A0A9P4XSU8_CRYP1|nr:uncharacterized protein M406DRAFT_297070 [Cryphonectria parasitica EP155]KAF3760319.1 hypothetical protein M406DRAFT_297070 [Cryphonectria parasitica EP155]